MMIHAHIRFLSVFLLLSVLLPNPVTAITLESSDTHWGNVSVDGKYLTVYCVYQDRQGLAWLGTNGGLYFYDGIKAHAVGEHQLFANQIYGLQEKDGKLYIAGNNGLFVYEYRTRTCRPAGLRGIKELRSLMLIGHTLWVGGIDGLYTLNLSTGRTRLLTRQLPNKSVYSMLQDSRGIIYIGTYSGLARWNNRLHRLQQVTIAIDGHDVSRSFVNCLAESGDGNAILVGTEGHLFRHSLLDGTWSEVNELKGYTVKTLQNSRHNSLFIGTDNGLFEQQGNIIYHHTHDARFAQTLSGNEVWCTYVDRQDNIWVGHDKGLSIAGNADNFRSINISYLTHQGGGNDIYAILRDSKGRLWLGGNNGILRVDTTQHTRWFQHDKSAHSLSNNRIRVIFEDSQRQVWFATDGGINKYDPATDGFDHYIITDKNGGHRSNWVYTLGEEAGDYWVGSYLGGYHIVSKQKMNTQQGNIVADRSVNTATQTVHGKKIGLKNDLVNSLVIDETGTKWLLHFRDNSVRAIRPDGRVTACDIFKITGTYPTHLIQDSRGRVWCAFQGGAVVFHRGHHRVVRFPSSAGDERVLAVGTVNDDIWVSTQTNVWKISGRSLAVSLVPIPQKAYTAIYYDKVTHKVLLGGVDELVEVDPGFPASGKNGNHIRMVLSNQDAGGYNPDGISSTSKRFSIPYGGHLDLIVGTLDYAPNVVQRYLYKVAESAHDTTGLWQMLPAGVNTLSLTDLSMGWHTVLIKVAGTPTAPYRLTVEVERPWFLSWGAMTVYILLISALFIGIYQYSRRRSQRVMKDAFRKKTLENMERKLAFLTNISHDLKTPLSMIVGPVSIVKEHTTNAEDKANLELVYTNAVKLNNMIHKTLELNRVEDGDESLTILSVFNVVDFCKEIFQTFERNNPARKFVFHTSYPRLTIEADAVKLESVFTNLFSNACKYSEEGATISCGIDVRESHVEIVVSDDGMGISQKDQPYVFQRMFRSSATSQLREGTGIGLYLIKQYLELMNGSIHLFSQEGQGTSFVVSLPVSDDLQKQLTTDPSVPDGPRTKILIVEDNQQISRFIHTLLRDQYACMAAENGRTGLSIASSFMPHLIILDEMMPIMSGMEMLRRLKTVPRLASIPVIMLTAKDDNHTEVESVKLGVDVFMSKPFEPQILKERVRQLLERRQVIENDIRLQTITEPKPIEAESVIEKQLAKVAGVIEDNIKDPDLNVSMVSRMSGISDKQLYRLIKKHMNETPLEYIRRVRLQKAAMLLGQQRFTIAEIAYMVGFSTPSYFTKCFQKYYGVKPSQYRAD